MVCSTCTRPPPRCAPASSGRSAGCSAPPSTPPGSRSRPIRRLPHRAGVEWRQRLGRGDHLGPARLEPPPLRGHRGPDRHERGAALLLHARPRGLPRRHRHPRRPHDPRGPAQGRGREVCAWARPRCSRVDKLLGKPWDDELETFRHAGEGAPVRWLHRSSEPGPQDQRRRQRGLRSRNVVSGSQPSAYSRPSWTLSSARIVYFPPLVARRHSRKAPEPVSGSQPVRK